MKTCVKCLIHKELSEFVPRKGARLGVRGECRNCTQTRQRSHKLHNKEYYDNYWKSYFKTRYNTDLNFKLTHIIRKTVNRGIFKKQSSSVKSLGCSVGELRSHLESMFKSGMSWDNHGRWHIDHIRPLSSFDLNDPSQFNEACHYKNLQPLWAIDNISKGNSFYEVSRPSSPR
jgi:hypothetical protein